jgi:hypothetical protein
VESGVWFTFADANGTGYAQVDHLVLRVGAAPVVVECKLSLRGTSIYQIIDLYRPILEQVYGAPVLGVLACKHLRTDPGKWLVENIQAVLDDVSSNIYTWHWLGR